MGRFDHRLSHPLPSKWESARLLRTALASKPWQPLGRAGVPVEADPKPLQADGVQWLGHATCLLQIDGVRIVTDPIFGRVGPVARAHPAPLAPGSLRPDVVLISHDHPDHLDKRAARALRHAKWRVPLGTERWCRRQGITDVEEFDWGEEAAIAPSGDDGNAAHRAGEPVQRASRAKGAQDAGDLPSSDPITFRFVGADHWCRRSATDRNERLWGGWRIDGSWSAYFAGDTGDGPRFREALAHPAPDVAMLPIGGCEPRWFMRHKHLSPEDVAQTMATWPETHVVPIHWGTYRIAVERLDSIMHRLHAAWHAEGRAAGRLHVLPVGGCLLRTSF